MADCAVAKSNTERPSTDAITTPAQVMRGRATPAAAQALAADSLPDRVWGKPQAPMIIDKPSDTLRPGVLAIRDLIVAGLMEMEEASGWRRLALHQHRGVGRIAC